MLLSDTVRGQAWLANFLLEERASATLLLDSLELVGQDDLRDGLSSLLGAVANTLAKPIALVPVRELNPQQSYFAPGRDAKPRLLLSSSFPGSEAIVANILGGAQRAGGMHNPFVAAPSLTNMRAARCRTVLFVDDFSGSGDRIVAFKRAFEAHPTVRSWRSFGYLDLHVAVLRATPKARHRLEKVFGPANVHLNGICHTLATQGWPKEEYEAVKKLCEIYKSSALMTPPLGHGSFASLIAFSHSAPNNLPVILWQMYRTGHPNWSPFFLGKGVPDDLRGIFMIDGSERKRLSALARMRQPLLAAIDWSKLPSAQTQNMLLVLAATSRRARDYAMLAQLTGLSVTDARLAASLCQGLRLIDRGLHLTDRGRAELQHAKSFKLPGADFQLQGSEEPYYPRKLRAGR